jgi:hypothetical protein
LTLKRFRLRGPFRGSRPDTSGGSHPRRRDRSSFWGEAWAWLAVAALVVSAGWFGYALRDYHRTLDYLSARDDAAYYRRLVEEYVARNGAVVIKEERGYVVLPAGARP